jgi:hypothetical protein
VHNIGEQKRLKQELLLELENLEELLLELENLDNLAKGMATPVDIWKLDMIYKLSLRRFITKRKFIGNREGILNGYGK